MSDISTSSLTTQSTTSNSTSNSTTDAISEQYTMFLELLTAQVQNQDPLSPMDSTQFVDQLATFTSIEQQVQTNDHLTSIASMFGETQAFMAGQWIGKKVSISTDQVNYSGENVTFNLDLPNGTDSLTLDILNSEGETVGTRSLSPNDETFTWDGTLDDDEGATNGDTLKFVVTAFDDSGDSLGNLTPWIHTRINSVGTDGGALLFSTESGHAADLSTVRQLAE